MSAQDAQPFHWRYPDIDDKNYELHGRSLVALLIAFAVILFLTLLCLYIRWACHLHPTGPSIRPPAGPSGLNRRQLSPLGLDTRVISSLPVLLHRQAANYPRGREGEESMCSICLSVFVDGEKVKMLPKCKHTFHPECVDEWLRKRSNCPLCRASIRDLQRMAEANGGGGGDGDDDGALV